MHGVASGLALDALCVSVWGGPRLTPRFVQRGGRWAGGRAGHAGAGFETRWGHVAAARSCFLGAHAFGAENTLRSLGLVLRVAPGGACWLSLRKSLCGGAPLTLSGLNTSSSMCSIIRAHFLFSLLVSC